MGLTAEEELKKYINHLISEKELNCPTCNSNTFYGALLAILISKLTTRK